MIDFYHSKRWERLREAILRRDGYMSQLSKRYGKRIPASTVHHIFPREDFPEYQYQEWNLISVTHDEHNGLHDRTTGKLSSDGLELLKRTARKRGMNLDGILERLSEGTGDL